MKKILYFAIVLVLVCSPSLFAAGAQEEPAGPEMTTITWASWALAEESLKPIYMSMVEEFMQQNPDINVETVAYPWAQYKDQIIISASAGNAPDVAHIKEEWVAPLKEMKALLPLGDLMGDKADFFPELVKGVTYDNEILCVPWFTNPYAMYYNKTLMKKAGVTDLPTNWSELMAAAKKISALGKDDNGNKIYGYLQPNSKVSSGQGYNFFPVMWAYGGNFADSNGNITLNTPENVAAFKFAKQLYEDEISTNGTSFKEARNLFAQGVIGFYYDIEMAAAPINAASPKGEAFAKEYSTMVIPEMNGPNGFGYLTQHHNVVFNTCENKQAAVKFAEFLAGKEVLKILFDAGMGKMPARASVLEMDIFQNPAKPLSIAFINAMPTAKPLPTGNKNFILADEAITDALTLLTLSDDSVEQIVAELNERVKDLYGQN
jgi:ABC-type glycerol-3-phosphate transport system substrate-binding protein